VRRNAVAFVHLRSWAAERDFDGFRPVALPFP
jgi:hypothetical protein